jgi:hypothetical protein
VSSASTRSRFGPSSGLAARCASSRGSITYIDRLDRLAVRMTDADDGSDSKPRLRGTGSASSLTNTTFVRPA